VVIGAAFFALIYKGLAQIQPYLQPYLFFDANWLQDLLFATLLIVILMIRPEGILREKSAPTLSRSRLTTIISSGGEPVEEHVGGKAPKESRVSRLRKLISRRRKEPSPPTDEESPNV
jgi:hypothetical protein